MGRPISEQLATISRRRFVYPSRACTLDLLRAPAQLQDVLAKEPTDLVLSLVVVEGREAVKDAFATSARTTAARNASPKGTTGDPLGCQKRESHAWIP